MNIKSRAKNKPVQQNKVTPKSSYKSAYRIIVGLNLFTGLGIGINYYQTKQNSAVFKKIKPE